MLTNVPARLYPTAARPPDGWLAGWSGLRKFARRTVGKGCGCNFFFFLPQTTLIGQWRAEKGRIRRRAYETLKISRHRDLDVASTLQVSVRSNFISAVFSTRTRPTRAHRRNKQISAIDSSARGRRARRGIALRKIIRPKILSR